MRLALLSLLATSLTLAQDSQQPLQDTDVESRGLFKQAYTIFKSRDWLDCKLSTGWEGSYPDGVCTHLDQQWMDVRMLKEGCRLFIYQNKDCTGKEKQVYEGDNCVDIGDYFSIRAFCG